MGGKSVWTEKIGEISVLATFLGEISCVETI
jgi:hypothetical protein